MARMTAAEWKKKKEEEKNPGASESYSTPQASPSNTTPSGGNSKRLTPSEWKAKKATTSVEWWAKSSIGLLNEIQNKSQSWSYKDAHSAYSSKASDLLSQADSWRKKYAGNDEVVAYIDSVVDALSRYKERGFKLSDYYSRWESEDHYNVSNMTADELRLKMDEIDDAKNDLELIQSVNLSYVPVDGYGENATEEEQRKYEDFRNKVTTLWEKYGKDKYDTVEDFYYGEFYTGAGGSVYKSAEEKAKGVAYTTKSGQNLTWQGLYDAAVAAEDLANRLDTYSKNSDWDELSKGKDVSSDPNRQIDYDIVFELSRSNIAYDKETALANGTSEEEWNDIDQKRRYIGDKYGVDLYDNIYANVNIFNEIMTMLDDKSWGSSELSKQLGEDVIGEQTFKNMRHLNDDEEAVLNYIFYSQGRDAALQWHNSRMNIYQDRANGVLTEEMFNVGKDSWGGLGAFVSPASLASIAMSVGSGFEQVGDWLSGDNNNTLARASSAIRSGVSEKTNWMIGNFDAFDFVYNTTMSGADSLAASLLPGKAGGIVLGLSAAAQATNDALDRGLSNEQAFWSGLSAGVFECLFESWSIGKFKGLQEVASAHGWDIAKNIAKSMLVNASEETLTEVANLFYDDLVNRDFSQYETMVRQYVVSGMTEAEAKKKASTDLALQIGESAASGALMGLGFGTIGSAGPIAKNTIGTAVQDIKTGGEIVGADGGVAALKSLAMSVYGADSKRTKQADKLSDDIATGKGLGKVTAAVKNISNQKAVGKMYRSVAASTVSAQDQANIAKELEGKGFSAKSAKNIADALAAKLNGKQLTNVQKTTLETIEGNRKVEEVVNNIFSDAESSFGKRSVDLKKFNLGIAMGVGISPSGTAKAGGENAAAARPISESQYEVSSEGKSELGGKEVVLKGFKKAKDGSLVVATADNQTADPSEVKYPSKGHALVYESYANIETTGGNPVIANMDVETRSILARAYDPAAGVAAKDYIIGSNQAYWYGFEGIPMNEKTLPKNSLMRSISEEQRALAYDLGKKAGKQAAQTQEAGIKKAYEKAVEKLGGKEAADEASKKNKGKVVLEDKISESTMTKKQKASYELAKIVAEAVGANIHVYHGMKEYGRYDPDTGDIWLNINGNFSGSSMMAFTLAHELVHMAKQWKPADFKSFADYLLEQYGNKGVSVEALIQAQIANAKLNEYTLDEHTAYEEVIADACQRMLLDSDAVQKMASYKEQNPSNWQKIVDKIWEFITSIRNLFKGTEPDSMEAALYKSLDEDAKQYLEKLFVDMVMGAGEHMSTIHNAFGKGTVVEVNADGEFTLAKGKVDGATKFLYNDYTWETGGRDTLSAALKAEGFSDADIKAALTIMDGKHNLVKELAEQFPEQDRINQVTVTTDLKDGHSVLSALVSNGDYPVNIDLLMVCKKRKAYQRVINRLCETGMIQQATVDALAIAEINKILGKYGFETACLGCFVESRRLRIQEWANTIVKEWNSEVKKRNPEAKAFGFGKGKAKLTPDDVMQLIGELESAGEKNDQGNLNLGQGSAVKRMGVLLDKVPSLRKTLSVEDLITPDGLTALRKFDSNLFSMVKSRYGSNSPKFVQEFNPYNHELAKYGKVPSEYKSLREYLYAIGGARMQSFSDFIVENWFDYCQIVADLAARKLPMHTYTKEISLAKLFGLTGIKINMSLIPDIDRSLGKEFAGLTRNANGELELIWADKDRYKATGGKSYMQSINFADAIALQNDPRYSANVGTIAVGVSDKHILTMLDDARVRMIIPYHSSGMNPIFADLMGTSYYKDYTMFQNTTVKQLYNSKGQPVSLKLDKTQNDKLVSGFQFNEVLQELGDARAAAQAYKDWCADASKHTITIKGETYTAELTPKFDSFSWHDNYYKLLEDFNTYDCISEEAAQQGDVQQIYPEDFDQILRGELTAQESHRQKQVENQAFDKAMGEIESYLQNHTKADTVFYAEQHGVKLSAKDKKLGAEDKKKLAGLRKGEKYSMPKKAEKKITLSMTDAERTDILKDKVITAEVYEGQAESAINRNRDDLESGRMGLITSALQRIGDEFKVFTGYNIKDVDVRFEFSKSNIDESVSKKITPETVAKLIPVFKNAVEFAIGIESHANRYFYDTDIVRFDNLVGGYVEDDYFVPVRFGLKHRRNGEVILYVIVDQQKIPLNKTKAEVVEIAGTQKVQPEVSRSAFKVSIPDIVPFVNSGDLLRYLPDNMLSEDQKKIKWEAIAATIVRTNEKNDAKYAKYIREGKLRAAAQMVKAAANDAEYTTSGYHGSRTPGFTVVDKYSWLWLARDKAIASGYGTHNTVDSQGKPHNEYGVYAMRYNLGNNLVVYADGASWGELPVTQDEYPGVYADEETGNITTNAMAEWAERNGYDSITFVDVDDGGLTTVDVVFNPNRDAKSADTITYDDNGNVIPLSQRFNVLNKDLRYKTPNSRGMSSRQLLADAFDELVQSPDERKLMDQYRNNISKVEEVQERLRKLRGEISRLTKAKGDKAKIAELNKTAKGLADLIDRYDRKLLELEASKPLKDVLARARSAAYQEAKRRSEETLKEYRQQVSERFDRGVEGRRKTEMRKKIRKVIRDLDKILNRGDKKRNVKEDMKDFVAEALSAAEVLFTDNYTNEDIVRNGFGVELSNAEAKYLEEVRGYMDELAMLPAGGYDAWQARQEAKESLKSKIAYRMSKLNDAFFRERQRLNKAEVAEVLGNLADSYAKLETSEYAYVNGAYHEAVYEYLKMLQEDVGGAKVKDMTLGQLEELYKAYTMVLTTVQNANKMFADDLKQSKEELANRVMMEVYKAGGEHGLWSKGQLARNQASWNNTKPIYAAERTGSSTFVQLVKGLFKGQYNWATDMEEAKAFRKKIAAKYGFKNWDMEKTYKFTSSSGIEFELNLNQIMSLYAYAKREQAHDHLLKGGFVFGKNTEVVVTKNGIKRTYLNKSAKAHNISDEIMGEIVGKLTKEQKGFVDEMQDYLSTTMGGKGNEVSMRLYGVKLFMEKFYFPLRSAGQFKEKAKEAEMKQQQGQISIANSGFTKATTPKSSNPVVLDGFTDVWASHVNEMSLYHSMVLPMEDFRRVYNYASPNMEGKESASVNSFIENAYGDAATGYFDQLYKELNGGAIVDPRENLSKQMIGKFKKSAVMLSNSVWVQQFSAIGRAYALIDSKHFIGPKIDNKKHAAAWNELKQYAPVAIIKEMGGFDTHTGLSAKDYLLAEEYGKGEMLKGLIKDGQYRDEIMGLLPAKADELTWVAIWEAVKRETKAKHSKMDVKSEEFLKKAGERFSEVIEKTQVYDSVLARSANMRSKNGLMQMLTAFMAEPTTTVNMVEYALRKGDKKTIARTFGAVAATVILNNALASIVYAMRDDDEDETFLEKYAQAFSSGMLDDINPMTYYPILKDIWSLFQGYDIERSDMAIYSDIADSVKKTVTMIANYDDDMDEDETAEYYKKVTDALMSLMDAGAAAFGVPLKNVRRDFMSYYNTFNTVNGDLFGDMDTTWNSFLDAVGGSALDSIPIVGMVAGESKQDKLYDAIVSGDTEYAKRLMGGYKDQNAINNAIRKGLRENDPRIREAAIAWNANDLDEYMRIAREIIAEKHFVQDDVVLAIRSEANALKPDAETVTKSKAKGLFTEEKFAEAISQGDAAMANAIKTDIIQTALKNGKTAEEAEKNFNSSAKTELKNQFIAGNISENDAVNALTTYCGIEQDDAMADVQYWAFKQDYPDVYADDQWFDTYYEKVADSGLDIEVYMEYRNTVSTITGEGKKDRRMSVIHNLPISSRQKDALYLAEGWAESKLYEAPWH